MTLRERLRDRAVENVDNRRGYTMEWAPHPGAHRYEYDLEEEKLVAEAAADWNRQVQALRDDPSADPGARICGHDHRSHYLGGGIWVCFACWAKLLVG